ncbi:MAG: DUF4292 domain-containing protein [Bacteroidales bacterium]|nr:DUF4292 domain-containing protein [Bacteroidales bacterium]
MNKGNIDPQRIIITLLIFLPVFLTVSTITSCKSKRKAIKEPLKEYGADYLFTKLKENELKFDWLRGKFSLDFILDKKKTSVNGQLRIRKDSAIWLSLSPALGIEMFRMVITVDSIFYINKIKKTYFEGSVDHINDLTGTNIDFDVIQSLMIGNDLTYYEDGKFRATYDSKEYHLVTAGRRKLKKYVKNKMDESRIYIQNIFLEPTTFKITSLKIKEVQKVNDKIEAKYSEFRKIHNQLFSHHILYEITSERPITVILGYSKIILDIPQKMPFKIPPKYSFIY